MNMTLKEMMLQLNDRLAYIEEKIEFQHEAVHSLTESCALIAEGIKRFMADFYDDVEKPKPPYIKLPIAIPEDLLEKIKDPKFLKEFSDVFRKETESIIELEDELEKIQDQIIKGKMGES